ncbi:SAM-dependent methyltransferase [Moorena producens PAL-8-15-08-1]|uniref:SAM-dependent methyltransferase n=1 Tax=Moorena producens PAL-8-15-08-1 TaxID=1458985 RepID=A0A1D8TZ40_9CYAN|nr:class I SAM-dependent methyltransferase [Moorena producens]AOX02930.1 SAM-dependent methyltransferase [Moorena producens PAL-8-15-08-1]
MKEIFQGEVFADTANFDSGIRQLMPRYEEILDVLARCTPPSAQRILDLGCGTGETSLKILDRCRNAEVIAVDYSPRMLAFARAKIEEAGYSNRWKAYEGDFGDWANYNLSLPEEFDVCISSFAIHHLTDEMKLKLFQRIRKSLNPGGVFWNADRVLPESPALKQVYQERREDWAQSQGTTLAEVRAKFGTSISEGYSGPDRFTTTYGHLQMLTTAGFSSVAVPWKYYGMAVFGGVVATTEEPRP